MHGSIPFLSRRRKSSQSPKNLIRENFSHLVKIFNRIKIYLEELFEPADDENNDFESQEIKSKNEEGKSDINEYDSMTD